MGPRPLTPGTARLGIGEKLVGGAPDDASHHPTLSGTRKRCHGDGTLLHLSDSAAEAATHRGERHDGLSNLARLPPVDYMTHET